VSEFRQDPITRRWAIVAENRTARPSEYSAARPSAPPGDCPFCAGHESSTPPELAAYRGQDTERDGPGWTVRTIPNKFPSLAPTAGPSPDRSEETVDVRRPGFGFHEVVIESPEHVTLSKLPAEQVRQAVRMMGERVRALSATPGVAAVILFENFGPESGGTLTHPHAQLVGLPVVPPLLLEEAEGAERFASTAGAACAFEQVAANERREGVRMVLDDGTLTAYAPFASQHPFEVRVQPLRHAASFGDASEDEQSHLAEVLQRLLRALDRVVPGSSYNFVSRSFAQGRPEARSYHWHFDLLPRLIRPDGFEVGGGIAVNPVPPESAAAQLRAAFDHLSAPDPVSRRGQKT
jgi:UDPglucose--hexose-1-phosphate uridylyltransferase